MLAQEAFCLLGYNAVLSGKGQQDVSEEHIACFMLVS
jgi:hypothetical protein